MKLIPLATCLITYSIAVAAEFSIYLIPNAIDQQSNQLLQFHDDIHIEIGGKKIHTPIKEGRQTITYPCVHGQSIRFIKQSAVEDGIREQIIGTVQVPESVHTGLILIQFRSDRMVVNPLWWKKSELRDGDGVFVNFTRNDLGLECGNKKLLLKSNGRKSIHFGTTAANANRSHKLQIFTQGKNQAELFRVLSQSIVIPKNDAGIFLIIPKMEHYVSLIALDAKGIRDPVAKEEVEKLFNDS